MANEWWRPDWLEKVAPSSDAKKYVLLEQQQEKQPATSEDNWWAPYAEEEKRRNATPVTNQEYSQPTSTDTTSDQWWTRYAEEEKRRKAEESKRFEIPTQQPVEPPPESSGFLRQAADIPTNIGLGITSGLKNLTDLLGADNALSQSLAGNERFYSALLSAEAKHDQQTIAEIMKEAEGKGILPQIAAGIQAAAVAPVDLLSNALGSMAPIVVGGLAGRFAGVARAAQLGLKAEQAASAVAGGIKTGQLVTGMGMGAGNIKSQIYDSVKTAMVDSGKTEEEAQKIATDAQSYNGKNLPNILFGAGLGALDAWTGSERIIGKVMAKSGLAPEASRIASVIKSGFTEAVPEAAQAAQERIAANTALQNEGVNVDLTKGVFSQAAMEGLIGMGMGGVTAAIEPRVEPTEDQKKAAASDTKDIARESQSVTPATSSLVEAQANTILSTPREQPNADLQTQLDELLKQEKAIKDMAAGVIPTETIPMNKGTGPTKVNAEVGYGAGIVAAPEALKRVEERQGKPVEPAPVAQGTRIEAAAYMAPDNTVYYGKDHLEAMGKALEAGKITQEEIDAKQEPTSRETKEFGFSTDADPFIGRSQAEVVATGSGQMLVEKPASGLLHSNEVAQDAFPQQKVEAAPPVVVATRTIADQPSSNLKPRADAPVEARPTERLEGENGRGLAARQAAWDDQYGDMRRGGRTHNEDGTPYQPTVFDETMAQVNSSGVISEDEDAMSAAIGTRNALESGKAVKDLVNNGWVWDATQNRMVNPANPEQRPSDGLLDAAADAAVEGVRQLGEVNPLNEKQIVSNGVKVEVERQGQNINIKDISSPEQGLGKGTEVLKSILNVADDNGVAVVVTPQPTGTTTEQQLRKWYSDNGFVDHTQGRMIRRPTEAVPTVSTTPTTAEVDAMVVKAQKERAANPVVKTETDAYGRTVALRPKDILNKSVRSALRFISRLNIGTTDELVLQDAAAILAESGIPALDKENIVSLASKNIKTGRSQRFWGGDIGMASTKKANISEVIHEVGHSLTADQILKYAPRKSEGGKEYIARLNAAINNRATPEPVRRLFSLYTSALDQLGIADVFGEVGGVAGQFTADMSQATAKSLQAQGRLRTDLDSSQLYGLANVEEFVSQAWSSPTFRDLLKTLKAPDGKRSMWSAFVDAIKQVLNLPNNTMAAAVIEASFDIGMEVKGKRGRRGRVQPAPESDMAPEPETSKTVEMSLEMEKERTFQLLGERLYTAELPKVVVKETVQNGFDAIKDAEETGEIPRGSGVIGYSRKELEVNGEKIVRMMFSDNGGGMTPEILQNAFFTVGGTFKRSGKGSGGFGLAKLGMFMSADRVMVETVRDGVVTKADLTKQELVDKKFNVNIAEDANRKNGTMVVLEFKKSITRSDGKTVNFENPYTTFDRLIHHDLTVIDDNYGSYQDGLIGLFQNESSGPWTLDEIKKNMGKKPYTFEDFVKDAPNVETFEQDFVIAGAKKPIKVRVASSRLGLKGKDGKAKWNEDVQIAGATRNLKNHNMSVYSNGLFQFEKENLKIDPQKLWGGDPLPYNIVVDIDAGGLDAASLAYPFTNSREDFQNGVVKDYINQLLNDIRIKERQRQFDQEFNLLTDISGGKPRKDSPTLYNNTTIVPQPFEQKFLEDLTKAVFDVADDLVVALRKGNEDNILEDTWYKVKSQKGSVVPTGKSKEDSLDYFYGVGISKNWGGVNTSRDPVSVLVNPIYEERVDEYARTEFGRRMLARTIAKTLIHEINHHLHRNEGSDFTFFILQNEAYLGEVGAIQSAVDKILPVVNQHPDAIISLKNKFRTAETKDTDNELTGEQYERSSKEPDGQPRTTVVGGDRLVQQPSTEVSARPTSEEDGEQTGAYLPSSITAGDRQDSGVGDGISFGEALSSSLVGNRAQINEEGISRAKVAEPAPEVRESRREPAPLTQQDREYLDAVDSGDMETAQTMVDEAAKAAGYTIQAFHGSGKANRFDRFDADMIKEQEAAVGFFFATDRKLAAEYAEGGNLYEVFLRVPNTLKTDTTYPSAPVNNAVVYTQTLESIRRLYGLTDQDFAAFKSYLDDYVQSGRPNILANPGYLNIPIGSFLDSPKSKNLSPAAEAGITTVYNTLRGQFGRQSSLDLIQLLTKRDGITFKDGYVVSVLSPTQIKSADPVTYDEQGNVIPLSERFNSEEANINYAPQPDIVRQETEAERNTIDAMGEVLQNADSYSYSIKGKKDIMPMEDIIGDWFETTGGVNDLRDSIVLNTHLDFTAASTFADAIFNQYNIQKALIDLRKEVEARKVAKPSGETRPYSFVETAAAEIPKGDKSKIQKVYEVLSNNVSSSEATEALNALTLDEAISAVKDMANGIKSGVRTMMAQITYKRLMEERQKISQEQGNRSQDYIDIREKHIDLFDWISDYAKDLGQGVQAFARFYDLGPDGILRHYEKTLKKIVKTATQKYAQQIRKIQKAISDGDMASFNEALTRNKQGISNMADKMGKTDAKAMTIEEEGNKIAQRVARTIMRDKPVKQTSPLSDLVNSHIRNYDPDFAAKAQAMGVKQENIATIEAAAVKVRDQRAVAKSEREKFVANQQAFKNASIALARENKYLYGERPTIWENYQAMFSERFAKALMRDPNKKPPASLMVFTNRLTQNLIGFIPETERATSTPQSVQAFIEDALNNKEKYQQAFAQARRDMSMKVADLEEKASTTEAATDAYLEAVAAKEFMDELAPQIKDFPVSPKTIDRFVNQRAKQLEISLTEEFNSWYKASKQGRVDIEQSIKNRLLQGRTGVTNEMDVMPLNIPEADVAKLARYIVSDFKQKAEERRKKALQRFKTPKKTVEGEVETQTKLEKLFELINMGVITDEEAYGIIADKYKLPQYSKKFADELYRAAEELQGMPDQLRKKLKTRDLMAMITKEKGFSASELGTGFIYANMLSSPDTHIVNIIDTLINNFANGIVDVIATGDTARLEGILKGYKKGWVQAVDTFKTGLRIGMPGFEAQDLQVLETNQFGVKGGVHMSEFGVANQITKSILESKPAGILNYAKYVGRLLEAQDAANFAASQEGQRYAEAAFMVDQAAKIAGTTLTKKERKINISAMLNSSDEALIKARQQAIAEGYTGIDAEYRAIEITEEEISPEIKDKGFERALKDVYRQKPMGTAGALSDTFFNFINQRVESPLARSAIKLVVSPFVVTPVNIFNKWLDWSPYGFKRAFYGSGNWMSEKYKVEAYEKGSIERRVQMLKASSSVLVMGVVAALVQAGVIALTGRGPNDEEERKDWLARGNKPYRINVGGVDFNFTLTPWAIPLSLMANYMNWKKYNMGSDAGAMERLVVATMMVPSITMELPFMSGVADLFDLINPRSSASAEKRFEKFVAGKVGMVYPNVFRYIDRLFDPAVYKSSGIRAMFVDQTPFVRRSGGKLLNLFGEQIGEGKSMIERFSGRVVSFPQPSKESLLLEKFDAYPYIESPNKESVVTHDKDGTPVKIQMTQEQYEKFAVGVGQQFKQYILSNYNMNKEYSEKDKEYIKKNILKTYGDLRKTWRRKVGSQE